MWTPILKDFARRISPPTPRFHSPPSAPFNSASDAFQLHPAIRLYRTTLISPIARAPRGDALLRRRARARGRRDDGVEAAESP